MPRPRSSRSGESARTRVCYERLRPAQAVARRKRCPLAYLPLGIIEWHGPHNPLGLDGLGVHELCVRAAAKAVLPFALTPGQRGHVAGRMLMQKGFKDVVNIKGGWELARRIKPPVVDAVITP